MKFSPSSFKSCHLLLGALTLLLTSCAEVPVGTPLSRTESASPPNVSVGDQWVYGVRDAYTGIERGTQTYRVEQVSAGNITVLRAGVGGEGVDVYDSSWNWLAHPATNMQPFTFSPAYPAFDFPLTPGKTWRMRPTATDPADGRRFPVRVDGAVLGWERVKVPAGEFDAIKVRRIVYLLYWELGVRGGSYIIEHDWYAPAVRQSVRREARSRFWSILGGVGPGFVPVRAVRVSDGDQTDGGGPTYREDDWLVYELVSYSLK